MTFILDLIGGSTSLVTGLWHWSGATGNTGDGQSTVLSSLTLPGVFGTDGDLVEFEYGGTFSGAVGVDLWVYLGGTAIASLNQYASLHVGNAAWVCRGKVVRTSSSQARAVSTVLAIDSTNAAIVVPKLTTLNSFSPLSSMNLECRAAGSTLNDVQLNLAFATFYQVR